MEAIMIGMGSELIEADITHKKVDGFTEWTTEKIIKKLYS